ncbi:hypothetical protein DSL72_005302 [Monilinia vaccinii-corymbosi]|uniref:BTB domain-containing protein n=1 Tax=Monilinia vaccinii-corymbosi TaxID=61207 RepID=A0A8A3PFA8_9HELO|nr:hypothetical protein DSL72_005302 [Monilinia vaccinii-corymbosi]
MVKIVVGSEQKTWWLNEDLLSSHSIVFKRAFQGSLLEPRDKVMRLEEESPKAFHHLVDWILGKKLLQCDKSHDDLIYSWSHVEEWAALVKLSQMLMMDELMEAAIGWYNTCKNPRDWPEDIMPCPDAEEVKYICDHIPMTVLRSGVVHGLAATFFKKKMHEEMFELWYLAMRDYPGLVHDVMFEVKVRLGKSKDSSIKEDYMELELSES